MPVTVFIRLCLRLRERTINTDIGRQDHIGLNIPTGWPKKSKPPPIFQKKYLRLPTRLDFFIS